MAENEIDERTRTVLYGIIDSYIANTEPVGSRTLSRSLNLDVSPATIRNIMSDLSELGFLEQMHTSAGRIPTDKAFRFYVDSLVVANKIPQQIESRLASIKHLGTSHIEEVLSQTTKILAGLTQFVCVVTTPKPEATRLQRIEFIKINVNKILVILVTKSGIIRNKMIPSSEEFSQDFLNSIACFLNEQFGNKSLLAIRNQILESMVEDKERYDDLLAQAIRLGKKAFDVEQPAEIIMEGQFNLLSNVHFSKQDNLTSLMNVFEQKNQIMSILDHTLESDSIQIYIGMENQLNELQKCSLITAGYGHKDNMLGVIGVVGPTCMDYQKIIPVVDYTAKILSESITEQSL